MFNKNPGMTLKASVIIPTYEDWSVLQGCLDCLAVQTIGLDRFEVIVANNNPSPDVPATLRLPPNTTVVHAPKPGSYAARNVALRLAKGKALFFTDSDCLPDVRWIENGLSALARLGPTDRIAGAVEFFPNGEDWTAPELYDRINLLRQAHFALSGWCATANLVTTRAAFDLVGPFDEASFSGGDGEWGLRAAEAGSQIIFDADVSVRHPARTDFAALAKKQRRLAGRRHQKEVLAGVRTQSTVKFLLPSANELAKVLQDDRVEDSKKFSVIWVGYRLRLVTFAELMRLRYLRGKPTRS